MQKKEIDPKVRERIDNIKLTMMLKPNMAFFGYIIMRLELFPTEAIPTAAVDGQKIYYNPTWFGLLSDSEVMFVLAHEVLHAAFRHLSRVSGRDPQVWNWAVDYATNYILVREKIGTMPKTNIDKNGKKKTINVGLYDKKYADMAAEEIYEILIKEPRQKLTLICSGEGFDIHQFPQRGPGSGDKEDDKEGKGGDKETDENGLPVVSEAEMQNREDEFESLMVAALQNQMSRQAGKVPGEIERLVHQLTHPEIDWRALLDLTITSMLKTDYSFQRPNRKMATQGIILPGMIPGQAAEAWIWIDTSGSMSQEMVQDCLTEVYGLTQQFTEFKIGVGSFDHVAYPESVKIYTEMNAEEIKEYVPKGGGGTNFGAVWDYLKENEILPQKLIMLTDGYCGFEGCDENYVDTVWLINKKGGNANFEPPFGVHAFWKSSN